jgi:uncharacterized cupin superfamily protein
MPILHADQVKMQALPGRDLGWLAPSAQIRSERLSACIVRLPPGSTVRPAHAHPNGEELVYVVHGHGQVAIDGRVDEVRPGSAILFPQGSVHMLRNSGEDDLEAVCFYAPPSDLSTYRFYEEVEFPESSDPKGLR